MKAEVNMSAGNEDEDASTSSLMLLWFSVDEGSIYYNADEPRKAITLGCAFPAPTRKNLQGKPEGIMPVGLTQQLCCINRPPTRRKFMKLYLIGEEYVKRRYNDGNNQSILARGLALEIHIVIAFATKYIVLKKVSIHLLQKEHSSHHNKSYCEYL